MQKMSGLLRLGVTLSRTHATNLCTSNFLLELENFSTLHTLRTSIFELPLWKFKADEVDEAHPAFYTVLLRRVV